MSDELQNVAAGALLYAYSWQSIGRLVRVERVTATQLIVGCERYRRSDGGRVGGSGYDQWHVRVATPEDIERVRRDRAVRALQREVNAESTKRLPVATLERWLTELRDAQEPKATSITPPPPELP